MRAFSPHPLAWGAVGVFLLISFFLDFRNVQAGGSIDLRNRVTGTRLLLNHLDPYFYKWREPAPPEYCDPYNNPQLAVSKTTATPAMLLVNIPIALLPYRAGQFVWLVLQWLLLLGATGLWLRLSEENVPRLILAVFVTGFTYTAAWRLHAERGQSYVLLLFLFACWLRATLPEKSRSAFLIGMLAGLLAALRPPFLFLAPFIILHRRSQLAGAGVGLLLFLILPVLWQHDCWTKYEAAMNVHSELYRDGIDPAPGPERFPAEIEGMSTDLLANYVTIPYADFSVHALLREGGLEPFPAWPPLALGAGAYALWLWQWRNLPAGRLVLGMAGWLFVIDLLLPAYRDSYNDVLIVNIVALGLMAGRRMTMGAWACFAALPIGWAIYVFAPMRDGLINLPSWCFMLGAISFLFWFRSENMPRTMR